MKPLAAAAAGAVISGLTVYTVSAGSPATDAFIETPALVRTVDGQDTVGPAAYATALRPAAAPAAQRRGSAAAPRRTVYRAVEPSSERVVVREDAQPPRSWGKTGLIIGGAAASGAGVGAIVSGRKGALIGAAIGGGAASIYEATRRD